MKNKGNRYATTALGIIDAPKKPKGDNPRASVKKGNDLRVRKTGKK